MGGLEIRSYDQQTFSLLLFHKRQEVRAYGTQQKKKKVGHQLTQGNQVQQVQ